MIRMRRLMGRQAHDARSGRDHEMVVAEPSPTRGCASNLGSSSPPHRRRTWSDGFLRAASGVVSEGRPGIFDWLAHTFTRIGQIIVLAAFCAAFLGASVAFGRAISPKLAPGELALPVFYPEQVEVTVDPQGRTRGERIVEALLEAAPNCMPVIETGDAPVAERKAFRAATAHMVHRAQAFQRLLNVEYRVERFGDRLYGVIYGERYEL